MRLKTITPAEVTMGVRAILQRGRGAHNLVLPADAVGQVNNRTVQPPVKPSVAQPDPSPPNTAVPPERTTPAPSTSQVSATLTIERGPLSGMVPEKTDEPEVVAQPEASAEVEVADPPAASDTGFVLTEPESIAIIEEDQPVASVGDDFTEIPGIGQAIARRLKAANINTFQQLLESDRNRINRIFGAKADDILAEVKQRIESAE